jgi:fibronectin type 3 domain-containing protein
MKKLLGLLVLAVSLLSASAATLSWNANPETDIYYYSVYQGVNGGTPVKIGSVTNGLSFPVNPPGGTNYTYQVTAVNLALLESDLSSAVNWFQPIGVPPENVILTKSIADYQGGAWKNVALSWRAADFAKYGLSNYVVNVKNVDTTIITKTTVTTTNLTIASLPLANYEIFVTTQNSLGISPVGVNSTWVISSRRPNAPLGVKLQ